MEMHFHSISNLQSALSVDIEIPQILRKNILMTEKIKALTCESFYFIAFKALYKESHSFKVLRYDKEILTAPCLSVPNFRCIVGAQ